MGGGGGSVSEGGGGGRSLGGGGASALGGGGGANESGGGGGGEDSRPFTPAMLLGNESCDSKNFSRRGSNCKERRVNGDNELDVVNARLRKADS